MLKIKDPTIPSLGTRPTYFTGLSTRSYESIKSLSRKPILEKYMTIRVKPERLVVQDYEPGNQHECSITIHNHSKKMQYLSLGNTITRLFQLAKDSPLEEFFIAPGLDRQIKVIFTAPIEGKSQDDDASERHYVDRLEIHVRQGDKLVVPMEAFPPPSKLEFADQVSFGTLAYNQSSLFSSNSLNVEEITACKKAIKEGWISKKVKLTNSGRRAALFSFEFDQTAPIRISPLSGTLAALSSCYFQIDFLPAILGDLSEKVRIKLENQIARKEKSSHDTLPYFYIMGNVIDRKIKLTSPRGIDIAELSVLDLGSVYFGQSVYLPVVIRNQDGKKIFWSIIHSGKNEANVPKKNVSSNLLAEQKTAFQVVPSEGELEPGQVSLIKIKFEPKATLFNGGFKNQSETPAPKNFKLPIELQTSAGVFDELSDSTVKFEFQGTAQPFLINFSHSIVSFPRNDQQKIQHTAITISNPSHVLGAKFNFEEVAQFDISPTFGTLDPLESITINITFRPNQYGHFQITSSCSVTPLLNSDHISLNSELRLLEDNVLATIPMNLVASWLPGVLPPNIKQSGKLMKA